MLINYFGFKGFIMRNLITLNFIALTFLSASLFAGETMRMTKARIPGQEWVYCANDPKEKMSVIITSDEKIKLIDNVSGKHKNLVFETEEVKQGAVLRICHFDDYVVFYALSQIYPEECYVRIEKKDRS